MRLLLIAVLLAACNSSSKPNHSSTDSSKFVPVYVIQKTDTVKVDVVIYQGPGNTVKYSKPGSLIRSGQGIYDSTGQFRYIPKTLKTIGALDSAGKAVIPL